MRAAPVRPSSHDPLPHRRGRRRLSAVGGSGEVGFLLGQELAEGSDRQHPVQKAIWPRRMLEVPAESLAGGAAPELASESWGSSAFAHEPPESLTAVAGQTNHEDALPTAGCPYPRALSLSRAGPSRRAAGQVAADAEIVRTLRRKAAQGDVNAARELREWRQVESAHTQGDAWMEVLDARERRLVRRIIKRALARHGVAPLEPSS
jgi:hypothetical protein